MDKYYVPDEDTRVGRRLVNMILALEGVMATSLKVDFEEEGNKSSTAAQAQTSERIFGSWNVTHPAGASMQSQNSGFKPNTLVHPASFAAQPRRTSKRLSKAAAAAPPPTPNMSEEGYLIVRSLENLANLAGEKQAEEIKVMST